MIYNYDLQHEDEPAEVPNIENEFISAKTFLQKASSETGDNLYDHLTDVLNKILAERPENIIDFFEEYSRKVKERRFLAKTDHLEDIYVTPGRYKAANTIMPLLKPLNPEPPSTLDPTDLEFADFTKNNMLECLYYLEQAGLGLPRTEMYYLTLSIRKLIHAEPVSSVRFWGKIFGRFKNYIILETELNEDEYIKKNEVMEDVGLEAEGTKNENLLNNALESIAQDQEIGGEGKVPRPLPEIPVSDYREPPEVPPELSGIGINKKVFYVCNGFDEPWIRLPDTTPQQIKVARQVYVAFSGNLEQEIHTYPEFPGKEKEYLRAQIARISAGTQLAPLGYYTFEETMFGEGGDEEEPDESPGGTSKTVYQVNRNFRGVPLKDLLDNSMSFWVHQTSYILPQGRTNFWSPFTPPEIDEDMGEEELDEEEPAETKIERVEAETGPALLTPCSEDASLEAVPPWSVRSSSSTLEEFAFAIVRSNLWPGAYCIATTGTFYQNVYFGCGLKHMERNYSPLPLPHVQQEYPIGPEILEVNDPTGAEEEQWRIDHLPKIPTVAVMEEAEEEEEIEEEEEDED